MLDRLRREVKQPLLPSSDTFMEDLFYDDVGMVFERFYKTRDGFKHVVHRFWVDIEWLWKTIETVEDGREEVERRALEAKRVAEENKAVGEVKSVEENNVEVSEALKQKTGFLDVNEEIVESLVKQVDGANMGH